jgi:hypothetical protein
VRVFAAFFLVAIDLFHSSSLTESVFTSTMEREETLLLSEKKAETKGFRRSTLDVGGGGGGSSSSSGQKVWKTIPNKVPCGVASGAGSSESLVLDSRLRLRLDERLDQRQDD